MKLYLFSRFEESVKTLILTQDGLNIWFIGVANGLF